MKLIKEDNKPLVKRKYNIELNGEEIAMLFAAIGSMSGAALEKSLEQERLDVKSAASKNYTLYKQIGSLIFDRNIL